MNGSSIESQPQKFQPDTLLESKSHLKMDGWKTTSFLLAKGLFSERFVSFRSISFPKCLGDKPYTKDP